LRQEGSGGLDGSGGVEGSGLDGSGGPPGQWLMVAVQVGARRARGEVVLLTNGDVVLSPEVPSPCRSETPPRA